MAPSSILSAMPSPRLGQDRRRTPPSAPVLIAARPPHARISRVQARPSPATSSGCAIIACTQPRRRRGRARRTGRVGAGKATPSRGPARAAWWRSSAPSSRRCRSRGWSRRSPPRTPRGPRCCTGCVGSTYSGPPPRCAPASGSRRACPSSCCAPGRGCVAGADQRVARRRCRAALRAAAQVVVAEAQVVEPAVDRGRCASRRPVVRGAGQRQLLGVAGPRRRRRRFRPAAAPGSSCTTSAAGSPCRRRPRPRDRPPASQITAMPAMPRFQRGRRAKPRPALQLPSDPAS